MADKYDGPAQAREIAAARTVNVRRGFQEKSRTPEDVTADDAARKFGLKTHRVYVAIRLLRRGTAEEVELAERGELSLTTLARHLDRGLGAEERREARRTGGASMRVSDTQAVNLKTWAGVRAGLEALSTLPDARDAAGVARKYDRRGFVDARIEIALLWLREFHDVWTGNDGGQNAKGAAAAQDRNGDDHPRKGDGTAGA